MREGREIEIEGEMTVEDWSTEKQTTPLENVDKDIGRGSAIIDEKERSSKRGKRNKRRETERKKASRESVRDRKRASE